MVGVLVQVEVPHTNLSEVTRMAGWEVSTRERAQGKCGKKKKSAPATPSKSVLLQRECEREQEDGSVLFVKVDAVVVLATGITATSRMFSVLANTTITDAHRASSLPVLLQPSGLHRLISPDSQSIRAVSLAHG